jgi:hypothetical protein
MSRRERNHKSRSPRSTSCDSSSSSMSEEFVIDIKKRTHKKHRSDSSSSSESESEYEVRKRKHEKKDSDKSDKKRKDKCKDKPKKKSDKSCSDSDHKEKCNFDDVYKYYKHKLLIDEKLMVGGSSAYLNAYANEETTIPFSQAAHTQLVDNNYNIDHLYDDSPYYVREAGTYLVFFMINSDQSSQFTIFVNGLEQPLTRSGNNSGAGQLIVRNLLKLKKNDSIVVRSYASTSAIQVPANIGGLRLSSNITILIAKIAPYENVCIPEFKDECLSRRKKNLFKRILDKMLCDKELMLRGFNVYGSFYSTATQDVLTESSVVFDSQTNVNGLLWDPLNPTQIKILEDGIYKLFFVVNNLAAAQVAFAVNGVPLDYSIQGTNKGAVQLSARDLVELKKDDVVSVMNHTSANGKMVVTVNDGGSELNLSVSLTIFKISPICKFVYTGECKLNPYYKKCYEKFRAYLLNQKWLQLGGSSSYWSVSSDVQQHLTTNALFDWSNDNLINNVDHVQGVPTFKILEDGLYDVFFDACTNESVQVGILVNGVIEPTTIFGRNSGGGRCLLRQIMKLYKNDVLTVANYKSYALSLSTAVNAGGSLVGENILFMAFKLCPIDMCPPAPTPAPVHKIEEPKKKN